MVQAGPLVKIYIPQDKDTKRHKGYGFAEYETQESAEYALKLFSGLVSFYNRPVRFVINGSEKPGQTLENVKGLPNGVSNVPDSIVHSGDTLKKSTPYLASHAIFPAKENVASILKRCQTAQDICFSTNDQVSIHCNQPGDTSLSRILVHETGKDKFGGLLNQPVDISLSKNLPWNTIEQNYNRPGSILAHSLSPTYGGINLGLPRAGAHDILNCPIFPQKLVFSPHGHAQVQGRDVQIGSSFPFQGYDLRPTAFLQEGSPHLTPIGQRNLQNHTLTSGYHHLLRRY